jgi:leukotriene-A4 hydrolase
MPRSRFPLVLAAALLLVNARHRAVSHPATPQPPPADRFSVSQPAAVTTRHLTLDLTVDFSTKQLRGHAELDIENLGGTRTLVLDTVYLDVHGVTVDGAPAQWTLDPATGALTITIEPATDRVRVDYETEPGPPAIEWRRADQTTGQQQPFVYSINHPNLARSWIPIQDTPAVRMTYDATLRVPAGLMAVMSAAGNPTVANGSGVYTFHMPHPVPAYLIAFAAGRLAFHPFDHRTGVYAEPELMDDARWELQRLPEMVLAAERLAGPMPFSRHDVLFLPPKPGLSGMEHPMVNFVAADDMIRPRPARPPVNELIVHELAHDWAGNSAGLANWNDPWLSEGFATYLTGRILEELLGDGPAGQYWARDRSRLEQFVAGSAPAATVLHANPANPSAGFTRTAYLRGALFLRTLEESLGRPAFDAFLRRYFQVYAFQWVDDRRFLMLLRSTALRVNPAAEAELQLEEWLYEPGLPANAAFELDRGMAVTSLTINRIMTSTSSTIAFVE